MSVPLTPAMQQYVEIKSRYRDCILFFRMGDFYEMFFEDAIRASRLLDIALTTRDKEANIPMCGIPHHARNAYLSKLIRQGCKVAICEQMEEPGGRGLFRREVTEVVTPGLVFQEECLDARGNNFLAAVRPSSPFAYAALDATTGEFFYEACDSAEALSDALYLLTPSEFVLVEGESPEETPGREDGAQRMGRLFEGTLVTELSPGEVERFEVPAGIEGMPGPGHPARVAVSAALLYLRKHQPAALAEIRRVTEKEGRRYLALDEAAVRTLEIFSSLSGDRKGSLLWAVDRTRTSMGARLLRSWLASPLVDPKRIGERHEAVAELVECGHERKLLAERLGGLPDLSRLASRLAQDRSGPRDIVALSRALQDLPEIREALSSAVSVLLAQAREGMGDHRAFVEKVSGALREEAPVGFREGEVFREGHHPRVDELAHLLTHGREILAGMEARERERTGIQSLKIRYNRVFGYSIEVSRANLDRVPEEYTRRQTLVNAERFVTQELKEFEAKTLRAEEERCALEEELFLALREELKAHLPGIVRAAGAVAEIDVLLGYAELAVSSGYCRPSVNAGREIVIGNGRHPVVERILGRHAFVPNDCRLSPGETQVAVLTGPNMAGKSTYIRQVALIVLLAQAGSFVPADRAELGVVDRIFTRIGASDDISRGESTFMVEMRETSRILSGVTPRTLVVLDEVGRGTSTFDGLSIAWAVAEHLHDHADRPKVLFATHFHELTDIAQTRPRARNFHVAVREWQGEIIFLRRIDEGSASKSYGIQVARIAGIPGPVIERAREILKNLESAEYNEYGMPSIAGPGAADPAAGAQMDLFRGPRPSSEEEAVLDEIRKADAERFTPLDALLRLVAWKERLSKGNR
ncbi:MAG: DNA mismatch repair protein MutS [Deltaproteobacteria bacterium GWC2_65_14]|nr:MAG: DNA mismatch repair protein MutS [Deltaproteobacteria bacterium GWC2_65_14]